MNLVRQWRVDFHWKGTDATIIKHPRKEAIYWTINVVRFGTMLGGEVPLPNPELSGWKTPRTPELLQDCYLCFTHPVKIVWDRIYSKGHSAHHAVKGSTEVLCSRLGFVTALNGTQNDYIIF